MREGTSLLLTVGYSPSACGPREAPGRESPKQGRGSQLLYLPTPSLFACPSPRGCSPVKVEGSFIPGGIIYHCVFSVHRICELEIHKQGL